eukprot:scaffold13727_cov86-Cylindrotheca_fusiformis.AAC.1
MSSTSRQRLLPSILYSHFALPISRADIAPIYQASQFIRDSSDIRMSGSCCNSCLANDNVPLLVRRQQEDTAGIPSTGKEVDKLLADSMFQLSVEEREHALDDLHGIRSGNEDTEDAATIDRLLGELDRNLKEMKKGTLYELAERNDPSYVTSREFRVLFLRTSGYDPEASVHHMFSFFEVQKSLFGEGKIGKKILLEDLDDDATESLKSGAMQISASTDRAGRKIVFLCPRGRKVKSVQSETRARYYILMDLMESEEVQKKGIVAVYYSTGNTANANYRQFYSGMLMDLPLRLSGFHTCVSDWKTYYLHSVIIYRFPSSILPKFRVHCGSDIECLYKLGSFGISRDALPLSPDGFQLDNEHHLEWYRQRQQLEGNESAAILNVVHRGIVPQPNDVLFGRVRSNDGNRTLRKLVTTLLDEYNGLPRKFKAKLAEEVVDEISNLGGRFLKRNPVGEWEEVSHNEAVQKVAKTFRNCRRTAPESEEAGIF